MVNYWNIYICFNVNLVNSMSNLKATKNLSNDELNKLSLLNLEILNLILRINKFGELNDSIAFLRIKDRAMVELDKSNIELIKRFGEK